jgi:hypothetical protein
MVFKMIPTPLQTPLPCRQECLRTQQAHRRPPARSRSQYSWKCFVYQAAGADVEVIDVLFFFQRAVTKHGCPSFFFLSFNVALQYFS